MTSGRDLLVAARLGWPAWALPVTVGAVGLTACVVLAIADPNEPGRYPSCPFRALTGLDCPGCGTLRALHALTRGDPVLALDHNLLTVALLPVLLWAYTAWMVRSFRDGRRDPPRLPARAGHAVAAVVTVFWVVRNLPWTAVEWLGSGPV